MRNFRELVVWERAHQLTLQIYQETRGFPADERFGLTRQIRESASSIAANIAEGCGRDSDREFVRFLRIASGSASETLYHLILARDLGFLSEPAFIDLTRTIDEVRRMLRALIKRFRQAP